MKRRSFLGVLGGAAVAGPQAAKAAGELTMADLSIPDVAMNSRGSLGGFAGPPDYIPRAIAEKQLSKLRKLAPKREAFEKANHYINGLEPDVAGLRSVSLRAKIKMSRDISYERSRRVDIGHWTGILEGWLGGDA